MPHFHHFECLSFSLNAIISCDCCKWDRNMAIPCAMCIDTIRIPSRRKPLVSLSLSRFLPLLFSIKSRFIIATFYKLKIRHNHWNNIIKTNIKISYDLWVDCRKSFGVKWRSNRNNHSWKPRKYGMRSAVATEKASAKAALNRRCFATSYIEWTRHCIVLLLAHGAARRQCWQLGL